jgi:hypothetical protein
MNNKKNINVEKIKIGNNDQSSFSELEHCTKNKEMFNFLNKKQKAINIIRQRIKNKDNNKLIISDKEKNRNIKRNIQKQKNIYSSKKKTHNPICFKKGNVYCFLFINNYPIFTLGPQYYYPILLLAFNNAIFFIFIKYIYYRINYLLKIISISLLIFVDFTQLYTVIINPGIPKNNWFLSDKIINLIMIDENVYKEFNTDKYRICRKCNFLIDKNLKIVHCDICDLCCQYYDHHCPWIGKCIGRYTKYPFYLFLIGILFYILSSIITFIDFFRNIS